MGRCGSYVNCLICGVLKFRVEKAQFSVSKLAFQRRPNGPSQRPENLQEGPGVGCFDKKKFFNTRSVEMNVY